MVGVERHGNASTAARAFHALQGDADQVFDFVGGRRGSRQARARRQTGGRRGKARQIQQRADHVAEPRGFLLDHHRALVPLRGKFVGQAADAGQRRAQVMRDRGEHGVLGLSLGAERIRALGVADQAQALGRQRRVVRQRAEVSRARRRERQAGGARHAQHRHRVPAGHERHQQRRRIADFVEQRVGHLRTGREARGAVAPLDHDRAVGGGDVEQRRGRRRARDGWRRAHPHGRVVVPRPDLAVVRVERRADDLGGSGQRVGGAAGRQRLRAERGQAFHLGRAFCFGEPPLLGAVKELARKEARGQERDEHEPVRPVGNGERAVRRQEEHVEGDERADGGDDARRAAPERTRGERDRDVGERNVRLVEPPPAQQQHGGERRDRREPECGANHERGRGGAHAFSPPSRCGSRRPAR